MDDDGHSAGVEVAELDDPALAGDLAEKARREQDEQQQRDEHARPVLHFLAPCVSGQTEDAHCLSIELGHKSLCSVMVAIYQQGFERLQLSYHPCFTCHTRKKKCDGLFNHTGPGVVKSYK